MYCSNCGNKLNEKDRFCQYCGKEILNISDSVSMKNNQNDKIANILCIIAVILEFFGTYFFDKIAKLLPSIESFLASLSGVCPMVALSLIIFVRVKYPNNKLAKILLILEIVMIIVTTIFFAALMIACSVACSGEDWSNFG